MKRALASCGPRGTCAAIRACARVSVPRVAAPLSSIVIELTSHRSPRSLSLSRVAVQPVSRSSYSLFFIFPLVTVENFKLVKNRV